MRTVRVAVAGCGRVSANYLPHLQRSPHVEVVALCDPQPDLARETARLRGIEGAFETVDQMLVDVDFELLVNLTPIPQHASINRKGLEAGRNVWSEKPIATDLAGAQALLALARQRGVGLWGAPANPISPAFRLMADALAVGTVGRVHAAQGIAGSTGPDWPGSSWFYRAGGGSLFDLGVYNVTLLTGLLGPARGVVAMAGTALRQREIDGERITVEADDNSALILDHGNTVYSVIQTGFVYGAQGSEWTVQLIGKDGAITMSGFPWEPREVRIYQGNQAKGTGRWETLGQQEREPYTWQSGATHVAGCLARGVRPVLSGEHAVHVLEVMQSALHAAETGQSVGITSTFAWPLPRRGEEQAVGSG